jgi:2-dehydro-3-deoxyglucarate aldolase
MKLSKDGVSIGSWINSCSPIVAELMAICGYDFLTIDVEHAPVDIENSLNMLQAIKSGSPSCRAIVRVSGNSYSEIKRYMDAGADGIICPLVNSKKEAQNLVDAVKYSPMGKRGVGYSRSNNYGIDILSSIANDNDETFVCVQIEHIDAIKNLDDILSVEGIDAAIIGPYDLSASMGLAGQLDHPEMEEAIHYNLEKCQKRGIMPGIHVVQPDPEQVKMRIKQGYRFIAYSVDIKMISDLSIEGLKIIKS